MFLFKFRVGLRCEFIINFRIRGRFSIEVRIWLEISAVIRVSVRSRLGLDFGSVLMVRIGFGIGLKRIVLELQL